MSPKALIVKPPARRSHLPLRAVQGSLDGSPVILPRALDSALFTWADSTTDPTSERRDDLLRDKTKAVEDFFLWIGKSPSAVTPADVKAWQAELETRGLAPATIYALISRLSSFYNWARKDPALAAQLPANPVTLARPRSPKAYQSQSVKALDDQQMNTLLSVARRRAGEGDVVGKRDYAMLLFYFLTGMRREEIARLCWGDLQLGSILLITARLKGGQYRTCELKNKLAERALLDYLRASGRLATLAADSPLWTRHDRAGKPGKRLTSHAFVSNLKRYAALAGLGHIHLHQTRHTYARIVSDETGSLTETQDALGHQNPATTRHYVQRLGVKRDKFSDRVAERLRQKE